MKKITVNQNDAGQRVDKFLQKVLKTMPLPLIYKYIRKKRIKLSGKRVDIAYKLEQGDVLELYINDEFFEAPVAERAFEKVTPSINILYEDDNILLVDKRPGMVVHEDEDEKINTLIAHIQRYLYDKGEYLPDNENSFAPALCNRIDRNTGGIVIAAKNAAALRIINQKLKDKEIHKFYLCIVVGIMDNKSGELKGYLTKDTDQNRVFIHNTPQKDGRTIITRYRVLAQKDNNSLLEVELITGRTHQIRAHLASIGHPLLGDGKYGINAINKAAGFKYQALYSYKTVFDFKTPADSLDYLNGKVFKVKEVEFAKPFNVNF